MKDELNFFSKIQLIFSSMQARRDAALNGLLNDVDAPTKCPDLNYTVIADSPLLGFIQIDEEGARNGQQKIQPISTGQTRFQRDRLVLDWYERALAEKRKESGILIPKV